MLRRMIQTIEERDLIRPGGQVVVGCSGGADSVALLYALWFLQSHRNFHLSVAHLHHGLRGRAADGDACLVAEQCARLGLHLITEHVSVRQIKADIGGSVEMAARKARHDFFRRVLEQTGAEAVALAHHRNDQAETVLMRVLGGSGLDGLGGMDYRAEPSPGVTVIRPLLDVSREQIEAFLTKHRLRWREDRTNRDASMVRNRIRHRILPKLAREGFSHVITSLVRLADVVREESKLAAVQTKRLHLPDCTVPLPINRLAKKSIAEQRRIIRAWLEATPSGARALDFQTTEKIRSLLRHDHGSPVQVGKGVMIVRVGDRLECQSDRVKNAPEPLPLILLAVPGITDLPGTGWSVRVSKTRGFCRTRTAVGTMPCEVFLRRERDVIPPLAIRARRTGDRMRPTGLTGSVSLKQLFIDHKIPEAMRNTIPVLVAHDQVVWVAGYRVATDWSVSGSKAASWHVRIEQKSDN